MIDVECDIVIVGSGAGGLLTSIRASDLGLSSIVIEKTGFYGGTSAISGGGIWIPCNDYIRDKYPNADDLAMDYLRYCTAGEVSDSKLSAYIKHSAEIIPYLRSLGVDYFVDVGVYPDYYPDAPGALPTGRSMDLRPVDGRLLGADLYRMRDSLPEFKAFGKLSLTLEEARSLLARLPGWQKIIIRRWWEYLSDVKGRRLSSRDRRLNIGAALVGGLRLAMMKRHIPLYLNTRLTELLYNDNIVNGVRVSNLGNEYNIIAKKAVVLASGGFEQNQELRNKYFPQRTETIWSVTPSDCNKGDGLLAALAVGADSEFLDEAWWTPTFTTPTKGSPVYSRSTPVFFERGYPHSICVNRLGKRFTNEICSYHQFGQAMMRDNLETGANIPCWIIFDSRYRRKYPMASLMPSYLMPDRSLPADWMENIIFKSDTIAGLAEKVNIEPSVLESTIARFNQFALSGVDADMGRGSNVYNLFFGDPKVKPNQNLGTIEKAPFYAMRLELGDIGSKGGVMVDEFARVLSTEGRPISGLYATGNVSGSVMGRSYPGAGSTLGQAMTFAYIAANNIAEFGMSE